MNQILNAIRLKDRIIIISLMLLFAILLAVGIGAVTAATVEPHRHSFEYHLERGEDGKFDFVGVCTDEACEDPVYSQDILNEEDSVTPTVKVQPTCTSDGVMEYSFKPVGNSIVYTYEEKIPALSESYSHTYVAEDTEIKDGIASVTVKCTNEKCTDKETVEVATTDMTLAETVAEATCHTPKVEVYVYNYKGTDVVVTARTVIDGIPHTLNGVYATEYEIGDGYYKYGVEGITLEIVGKLYCGMTSKASYTCEVCSEKIPVQVRRDAHHYVYDEDRTILPTHTEEGKAYVICDAEDCTDFKIITLPKVVANANNVISQNQDLEEQTVGYVYVSGDYGFVVEAEITVPWYNHRFEYSEDGVVRPTFEYAGSITLKCQNSVCSKSISIPLPRMISEGSNKNTEITFDHILEKKITTYRYQNPEYGIDFSFSYDEAWIDHSYVYSESETIMPDFENDGKAYVRCYFDGCPKYHEITIPKIVIDGNAKQISPATEQSAALYKYSYTNGDYDFKVTLEFNVGEPLTHDYKYGIELNIFTGKFDFVGICSQPGCLDPEIREENVEVTEEVVEPTCTTDGFIRYTYEKDGDVYEETMKLGDRTGHNYEKVVETKPTWSVEGSVVLKCANDGCTEEVHLVLPKIEYGVTAFEINPELQDGKLYYLYSKEEYGYELFFLV